MGKCREDGDAGAHGVAHQIGLRNTEMIKQRDRVTSHEPWPVSFRIARLVAGAMPPVVDGNDTVAGITQSLQPARMNPVDARRRGKAMDQQHRRAGGIPLVEESEFQSIMGEA